MANKYQQSENLAFAIGPQIPVEIPGVSILLIAFEESAPLAFDVTTR